MGNYVSCTLVNPLLVKNSKSTKVILPTGEIKQIQEPIKAAELMMEIPNFFIVNSKSLKIGKRFSPLNADDDLVKANVYVMLPMHRKNSVATAKDLGALLLTANKVSGGRMRRVQPHNYEEAKVVAGRESDATAATPRLSLEGVEDVSTAEFMYRLSMSRSKRPLLETIDEEQIPSR